MRPYYFTDLYRRLLRALRLAPPLTPLERCILPEKPLYYWRVRDEDGNVITPIESQGDLGGAYVVFDRKVSAEELAQLKEAAGF